MKKPTTFHEVKMMQLQPPNTDVLDAIQMIHGIITKALTIPPEFFAGYYNPDEQSFAE